MLRIKLSRYGKKDRPTWRVVVVEKTKTGKGKVTDYIGNYDPHQKSKVFNLDIEKYEQWIKNGAQPTDAILRLKGKIIDKNKDYKKTVKEKVYKSKKPEEKVEPPKAPVENKPEEPKADATETVEAPAEEVVVEAPAEEKTEEEAKE